MTGSREVAAVAAARRRQPRTLAGQLAARQRPRVHPLVRPAHRRQGQSGAGPAYPGRWEHTAGGTLLTPMSPCDGLPWPVPRLPGGHCARDAQHYIGEKHAILSGLCCVRRTHTSTWSSWTSASCAGGAKTPSSASNRSARFELVVGTNQVIVSRRCEKVPFAGPGMVCAYATDSRIV